MLQAIPSSPIQCTDNKADRKTGRYWEEQFCNLAFIYRGAMSPNQIGRNKSAIFYDKNPNGSGYRTLTLPDVVIWAKPVEHHEIKHKNPTKDGCYGLEVYRFEALKRLAEISNQLVMYTIHNHDLTSSRHDKENNIDHWITVPVLWIDKKWDRIAPGWTWIDGEKEMADIIYWDTGLWSPLLKWWGNVS